MAPPKPAEAKRRYFSVEEANRTLPLVKVIVTNIVHQFHVVNDLKQRLAAVLNERRRPSSDPYSEELAQTEAERETEEEKLAAYIDELTKLGVELKGPDGLCDFYSIMDGREVYLCWRLGESEVLHWHELDAGVAGRQPLTAGAGTRTAPRSPCAPVLPLAPRPDAPVHNPDDGPPLGQGAGRRALWSLLGWGLDRTG